MKYYIKNRIGLYFLDEGMGLTEYIGDAHKYSYEDALSFFKALPLYEIVECGIEEARVKAKNKSVEKESKEESGDMYYIRSSFGYYRRRGCGTTDLISEAHKYSDEESKWILSDDPEAIERIKVAKYAIDTTPLDLPDSMKGVWQTSDTTDGSTALDYSRDGLPKEDKSKTERKSKKKKSIRKLIEQIDDLERDILWAVSNLRQELLK